MGETRLVCKLPVAGFLPLRQVRFSECYGVACFLFSFLYFPGRRRLRRGNYYRFLFLFLSTTGRNAAVAPGIDAIGRGAGRGASSSFLIGTPMCRP